MENWYFDISSVLTTSSELNGRMHNWALFRHPSGRYIKLCNFILLRMIHNITYQFIVQTHINQLIYNFINLVGMII